MSKETHAHSLFKVSRLQFIAMLLAVSALILGLVTAVHAAGTVTNCTDYSGTSGLQAALNGGGTVTFDCDGTIIVPEIVIVTDTTIDATGHTVTLSGDNSNRVFFANSGVKLELINITIADGFAADANGGGILNSGGTVALTNSTVSNNTANDRGGGILNSSGTVTLTNSTVSGNSANGIFGGGGGIYNISGGTVALINSAVSNNTADRFGGGIFNTISGTVKLTNGTVSNNTANDRGGGIINFTSGTVEVTNSTVSSNTADVVGGGIFNIGGTVTLTNSTISDNTTDLGGGGIINLRGFWLNDGLLTLINSTISGNSANGLSSEGGGIHNHSMVLLVNSTISGNSATVGGGIFSVGGTVTLTNSIIAAQAIGPDCSGSITSNGYNLDSDGTCNLNSIGDISPGNADLQPLQVNAPGNTATHALGPNSNALDQIPGGMSGCGTNITTDQRGVARPQGVACEIGAYEARPASLNLSKAVDDDTPTPGQRITYTIAINNGGEVAATQAVISDTLDTALVFAGPVTLQGSSGTVAQDADDLPTLASGLTIIPGERITVTFPVTVSTGLVGGVVIANTAAVTSTEVTTAATDTITVTVAPRAIYLPLLVKNSSN